MLCEKCGKSNPAGAEKCAFCGTVMPARSNCGGFGDILSYENAGSRSVVSNVRTETNNQELQKMSKKIGKLASNNKKLILMTIIALLVSVASLTLSLYVGITDSRKLSETMSKKYDEKIRNLTAQIEKLEKDKESTANNVTNTQTAENNGLVDDISKYYGI